MNYKKNVPLLFFLLLCLLTKSQDITAIRDAARTAFLKDADGNQLHYQNILIDLQPNGKFDELVDYPSHNFNERHLKLLVELTQARARKQDDPSLFPNITLMTLQTEILNGLNWWYQNVDYYDHAAGSNGHPPVGWWKNEIGKQRELQKISVLFFDFLSANPLPQLSVPIDPPVYPISLVCQNPPVSEVITDPITTIIDAISADFQVNIEELDEPENHVGANKADVATSIVAKGLLENCATYLDLGKMYLECVMDFTTEDQKYDGVRADYSFNQHNKENTSGDRRALLYSGGYGMSFMHNVAVWGAAFTGDPNGYDYTLEARQNFLNYVLEGYRWMVIGNMTDYSANGLDIAKKYPRSNVRISDEDMELLLDMFPGNADLTTMQSELGGNQSFGGRHHKHFWISDYVSHQEAGYFSSLHMCSDRSLGTETNSAQDENKRGFWLPYGCTFIYRTGDEYIRLLPNGDPEDSDDYENIFPFWDWSYVPGVTCPVLSAENLLPVKNKNDGTGNTQEEMFVGNASNDQHGVSTMILDKDYPGGNVLAKKAWFHFGDEVIALGADITDNGQMHTTVNQSLLEGSVSYEYESSAADVPAESTDFSANTDYVSHDGIAYIFPTDPTHFPDGQVVHISNFAQPGDWSYIDDCEDNMGTPGNECAASVSGDLSVFRTWIDHTGNNSNAYYYIIAPGQDAATYANSNPITLLHNTGEIQAVRKEGTANTDLAGIVYYPDGFTKTAVDIGHCITLFADQPCAILYDEENQEICVTSPDRSQGTINLTIVTPDGVEEKAFTIINDGTVEPVDCQMINSLPNEGCNSLADFEGGQVECTEDVVFTSLHDLSFSPFISHEWYVDGTLFSQQPSPPPSSVTSSNFLGNDGDGGTFEITHEVYYNDGSNIVLISSVTKPVELYAIDDIDPVIPSGYTEWKSSDPQGAFRFIIGTLTISPDAHLEIDSDVTVIFCGSDSKLLIQSGNEITTGGKVTLHGVLTDFNDQTWVGVQVEGISSQAQGPLNSTDQGWFSGQPNSVIENAYTGVRNYAGSISQNSGGIIQCLGTQFINNRKSVELFRYQNFNPNIPWQIANDYSRFRNCQFTINDDYLYQLSYLYLMHLSEVQGIKIEGCAFTNNMTTVSDDIADYGVGIVAAQANFRAGPYCNSNPPSIPCPDEIDCEFNNLGYGVYTINKWQNRTYSVQKSEFNNCFVGIRNRRVTGAEILFNSFNLGTLPENSMGDPTQSGICFEGSIADFDCQENSFVNTTAAPTDHKTVGVYSKNTEQTNKAVRRNTFIGLDRGNLAVGNNGNNQYADGARGLTFLCNTNKDVQTNGFDIDVAEEDGMPPSVVRLEQGFADMDNGVDLAAANTFSDVLTTASGFANTGPGPVINYWVDPIDPVMPTVFPAGSVVPAPKMANTCPADYCYPPCNVETLVIGDVKSEYYSTKASYLALKADYENNPTQQAASTLASYRVKLDKSAYIVVKYYLEDTLNYNQDSLFTWIGNLDFIGAQLWLSNEYLAMGDVNQALATLDAIPLNFTLSTEQTADLANYRAVTNSLIGEELDNLSNVALDNLRTYDKSGGQTEVWVQNILTDYGAHYPPEYFFTEQSAGQNSKPEEEEISPAIKSYLTVSPNPAKDVVTFKTYLTGEEGMGNLEVRDLSGRLVHMVSGITGIQSIRWETVGLPSGIYFYQLRTKSGILQSGKVILSK